MLKVEICAHPNRGLHAENIQKKLKAVRKSVGPLDLKVLDTIILSTLLGKYSYVGGGGGGGGGEMHVHADGLNDKAPGSHHRSIIIGKLNLGGGGGVPSTEAFTKVFLSVLAICMK